jgi:hypothetical protein
MMDFAATATSRFYGRAAAAAAAAHMALAVVTAALLLVAPASPAAGAEAIFPAASRLGLVPPAGMVASRTFQGFQEPGTNAVILLTVLPVSAYEPLTKAMVPEAMKKDGIDVERRDPVELTAGKGFVLSGRQTIDGEHYRKWLLIAATGDLTALVNVQVPDRGTSYSDQAVRAAFATLVVRSSVPEAEQLALVPFAIGDMAGFHVEDVLPARGIVLVDPPNQGAEGAGTTATARLFISALPGGPEEASDRDNFARMAFSQIAGIRDVRVQNSEPLRIASQPGYQTMAKAKDAGTGTDVIVVQWLRFGSGGFLRMIGIARAEAWSEMFGRLRTVRDSVSIK